MFKDYQIISDDNIGRVSDKCSKLARAGWEPRGKLRIVKIPNSYAPKQKDIKFVQVMVLKATLLPLEDKGKNQLYCLFTGEKCNHDCPTTDSYGSIDCKIHKEIKRGL